jgi:hypothetical protein
MRAKKVKWLRRAAAVDWAGDPALRQRFSRSDGNACNPFKRFLRAVKRAAAAERRQP